MRFKPTGHRSLSRRLWLGAAALSLMVCGVVLAWRAMLIERDLQEHYREALVLARLSFNLQSETAKLRTWEALLSTVRSEPRDLERRRSELNAISARIREVLEQIEKQPLPEAERSNLASLNTSLQLLIELQLAALQNPRLDTADVIKGSAPYYIDVNTALDNLLATSRTRTDLAARRANDFSTIARVSLATAAALLLILGVGLAAYVSRTLRAHQARLGQLDQLAHEDALTGVMNRRGLDIAINVELERARRMGYAITVAMLDLDYFKKFNDKRGHGAGDALLRGTAQAWRRQLRPTDLLARYGGEEFTLVLPNCDAEQATLLIDRLRPLMPDHQTFSAGVATWNGSDTPDEVMQIADQALMQAKRSGRNRTVIAGQAPQMALPLRVVGA